MKISHYLAKILMLAVIIPFAVIPGIVNAQELTIFPTPKPIEYELPYPGLLPDHPLYFLRAMRDTMQELLVSNPLKKAEFYLLQADKGVSASVLLSEKKDTLQLAGATAVSSQEYFERALEALGNARKQGLDTHEIAKKMVLANEKHRETLTLLEKGADEHRDSFTKAAQKAQEMEKKVKSFLSTK